MAVDPGLFSSHRRSSSSYCLHCLMGPIALCERKGTVIHVNWFCYLRSLCKYHTLLKLVT